MFDEQKKIEMMRNRKFIIWGLGSLYDKYAHCIDLSKVVKYVDRDPSKVGTLHNGLIVINPNTLHEEIIEFKSVVLIVSSSFFSEISELAVSIGFGIDQIIPISMLNIYRFYEMEYFMSGYYNLDVLIDIPGENLKFYPVLNNFHILNEIILTQDYYEADVLTASLKYIDSTEGGVVLDVGSNVGNHAFFWHQRTLKTVHCFEGDTFNFDVLKKNIELNDFSQRIVVHNFCVSDTTGDKYTFEVSVNTNYGANIARRSQSGDTDSIRLDDIVFNERVDLIKIDVEGMEPKVLRGARALVERDSPVIIFEAHTEKDKQACLSELQDYSIIESFLKRTPTYIAVKNSK